MKSLKLDPIKYALEATAEVTNDGYAEVCLSGEDDTKDNYVFTAREAKALSGWFGKLAAEIAKKENSVE